MDPVALLKSLTGVNDIVVRLRVRSYLQMPDGSARRFEPSHELVMVRTEAVEPNMVRLVMRDGDTEVCRTLFISEARRFLRYSRASR